MLSLAVALALAASSENRLLEPGEVELRLLGGTNVVLLNVTAGALVEVGTAEIGGGTLSLGAELDWGVCATWCGLIGVLTGLRYGQTYWLPSARFEYHFALAPNPTLRNIDLYVALSGGMGMARVLAENDAGVVYRGQATAPTAGAAAGISWFFGPHFFGGFEVRGRIAQGDFDITERAEGYEFKNDLEPRWIATGVSWMAVLGWRV